MTSKTKKKRLPIRNIRRAKYAELGLVAMIQETGLKPELDGWDMCVVDLLANVLHFCDWKGIDFDAAVVEARGHHQEETAGGEWKHMEEVKLTRTDRRPLVFMNVDKSELLNGDN